MHNEPATWRKCAAETRRIAADISDQAVREKYLRLAAGYDELARIAVARIELGPRLESANYISATIFGRDGYAASQRQRLGVFIGDAIFRTPTILKIRFLTLLKNYAMRSWWVVFRLR
jgi:hypothetical protein